MTGLDDLYPFAIWLAIELNVVIVGSSIPFLRLMFHTTSRQPHRQTRRRIELREMSNASTSSKKLARSTLSRVDSQENIIEPQASQYPSVIEMGIQVTHEVSVTYETSDAPFVHAALVGLVQGEIANPRRARR